MLDMYVLDDQGNPQIEPDPLIWSTWFAANPEKRRVACDEAPNGVLVSTVFLGIDHRFTPDRRSLLYETMIFGGSYDEEMERYSTHAEALAGHAAWLSRIKE